MPVPSCVRTWPPASAVKSSTSMVASILPPWGPSKTDSIHANKKTTPSKVRFFCSSKRFQHCDAALRQQSCRREYVLEALDLRVSFLLRVERGEVLLSLA